MICYLSQEQTKSDLTLTTLLKVGKLIITSASGKTRSKQNMQFEVNDHQEANTLMMIWLWGHY